MSIKEISDKIIKIKNNRDWEQFHNPKDLAISLSIESSELLERFQWKSVENIKEELNFGVNENVKDELADSGIYLLLLCETTGIDVEEAILDKIEKNNQKYPVNKSKRNTKKYMEL